MACSAPALSEPPKPKLPDSSAVRSERMSPYMLVVTITSKRLGARTTCAIIASTMTSSTLTAGKSLAALRHSSMNKPSDFQHVRLVNDGDLLASPLRQLERRTRDARAGGT